MGRLIVLVFFVVLAGRAVGQDAAPWRYYATDIVYDAEAIPNVSFEQFFMMKNKLKSWKIGAYYQMHNSNQFGMATSHGDRVSIGVYQGPGLRFSYLSYRPQHHKNRINYFNYGMGVKYLWYDSIQVNTGRHTTDQAYRIQSEKCLAVIPQIAYGSKHMRKQFCADFYIGLQFPVKFRDKTVYFDQSSYNVVNPNVPYHRNQVTVAPALLAGINLGLIKYNSKQKKPTS